MKKDRTMILNVNFVNVKYERLRPSEWKHEWVVELHGGCGKDQYIGHIVKLNLKSIDWLLAALKNFEKSEMEKLNTLSNTVGRIIK